MKNLKLCNVFKSLKTTVLGLIILGVALFGVIKYESFNISIFIILTALGLFLIFSPNEIIPILKGFVKTFRSVYSKTDKE